MKLALVKASTSQTVIIFILDSASTTGAGKTGIVFNAAGLTAYYARPRAAAAAITLATQTVAGAYSSGGFVEIDATNMPGIYRLDVPDAALATGVDSVAVMLKGAAGMAPVSLEIQLTNVNLNDGVRAGLTALPNAAAAANGGLATVDASNAVKVQSGTGANQLSLTAGVIDANATKWSGTAVAAVDAAGYPKVTIKQGTGLGEVDLVTGAVKLWAPDSPILHRGVAQNGSVSAIVLDTTASATNDLYKGNTVTITAGTGVGQSRSITAYNGTTKTATVDWNWTTAPDVTSSYAVKDYCGPKLDSSLQVTAASVQGNVTGSVASVTGAVGSVTGAVGSVGAGGIVAASFAANAINAAALAADAGTEIGTAVWATTTRELTAGTNIVLAKGTGVTGFNDLAAAGVAAAVWDAAKVTYGIAGSYGEHLEGITSGSTDWTAGEREQIRWRLGIDGAETAPSVNTGASLGAVTATSLVVSNPSGDAVQFTSAGGNGNGLIISGNGAGFGLYALGGATGHGAAFQGGATSGYGINCFALTSGHGASFSGAGAGLSGLIGVGGTNGPGVTALGNGAGDGFQATGGATGDGFQATGGGTSGSALKLTNTSGVVFGLNGVEMTAATWAQATRTLTTQADSSGITTLLTRIPGTVQPQTGDAFARLGLPAGASNAADVAGVLAEIQKVPRNGTTYKHTNTGTLATATVTIAPP